MDLTPDQRQQVADRDRLTQFALLGSDEVWLDPRLRDCPTVVRTHVSVSAAIGFLIGSGLITVTPLDELPEMMPLDIREHLRPDLDAMVEGNRAMQRALFPDGLPRR